MSINLHPCLTARWLIAFCASLMLMRPRVRAQAILTGQIKDTILQKECPFAQIYIRSADSSPIRSVKADKNGRFIIQGIPAGRLYMAINHPHYMPFELSMTVHYHDTLSLGIIALSPAPDSLAAAIVTATHRPPRMHGDTLEFNTSHIRTRLNASIEELLARLPGVQVDQDGNIFVNGQKVERLLIEGEDVFDGNPTLLARNFTADMVAKVQVLDQKSKEAAFTGVSDGQKQKTLNIVLRKDSKNGLVGKLSSGAGDKGYYNTNGLLGSFRDGRQLAVLGILANTGATGVNSSTANINAALNIDGGINDPFSASAGKGVPRVGGTALHYAARDGNLWHYSANYNLGGLSTKPYQNGFTQQALPDSTYTQIQQGSSRNSRFQQAVSVDIDLSPDSVYAFQFSIAGRLMHGDNSLASIGRSSFNDQVANTVSRQVTSAVNYQQFRANALGRITPWRNSTRSISFVLAVNDYDNSTNGALYSVNNYFAQGTTHQADTVDQRKQIASSNFSRSASVTYTEPLGKVGSFSLAYGLSNVTDNTHQAAFAADHGNYTLPVDSLTSTFKNTSLVQSLTVNGLFSTQKFQWDLGANIQHYGYRQSNIVNDTMARYRFTTLNPRIVVNYTIDNYKGYVFDYIVKTQPPSATQLQPLRNNNDPLHISVGNPGLRPSVSHGLELMFHSFRPAQVYIGFYLVLLSDAFSTRTFTDTLGRQVTTIVNVQGTNNARLYFNHDKTISPLDLSLGFGGNLSYSRTFSYVNGYLSRNDNYNGSAGFNLRKFVDKKYNIQLNSYVNYTWTGSSINSKPLKYWTQNHTLLATLFLPLGLEVTSNLYYNWRQKLVNFDTKNASLLWNAYVLINICKNRLALRGEINDLLDQNAGIDRMSVAGQTTENTYNVVGRYWMLSLSWQFARKKTP